MSFEIDKNSIVWIKENSKIIRLFCALLVIKEHWKEFQILPVHCNFCILREKQKSRGKLFKLLFFFSASDFFESEDSFR